MAEIITKEQLENASVDAKDLGECVHGNETGIVTPRFGDPYPTLPAAIEKIENQGGYISVPNLAALNAIMPAYNHQVARTDDNGNEYRWNPSATPAPLWEATGRNFLNESKSYTDSEIKKIPISAEDGLPDAVLTLKGINNWVFGSIGDDGSVDTPLFSITAANPSQGFIVTDEYGWILLEQGAADIPVDIPSWAEKKYMLFGDSITQTGDPDNGDFGIGFRANWWVTSNSELKAKSFMNFARSGASYREYPSQLTWQKISHQISYSLTTGYVPDVIIMSCATNDALTKLGTYEDAIAKNFADLDMTYTADAMRWAYHTLTQNYPKAKLFTCLPIQLAAVEPHTRQPLNDLLIKMANRYGFQVINVGGECGIVRDFETAGAAGRDLYDGVHPNASGILKIASVITPSVRTRLTNV